MLKKNSSSLQGLSPNFISQDFSRFDYLYLITFLVFKLKFLVCVGILRGKGVTVFSWVDFSPQYSFEHKVRETYKPW